MSDTSKKNLTFEEIVKPILVLSIISMVVSLLLAIVNMTTAPVIEANEKRATLAAYVGVLPTVNDAADLTEVTGYTGEAIDGCVKSEDGCYAIKALEKGFDGGIVTVIVGFNADGTVSDVYVDASTQTAGIGSHIADPEMTAQFQGLDGTQYVAAGDGVDGWSGATYSSNALIAAYNDCVNCYNEVAGAM